MVRGTHGCASFSEHVRLPSRLWSFTATAGEFEVSTLQYGYRRLGLDLVVMLMAGYGSILFVASSVRETVQRKAIVFNYTILYHTIYTMIQYNLLHYTIIYHIIYYTILYYTILYYTILYYYTL